MKTAAKIFIVFGIVIGFLTIICPIIGFKTLERLKHPRRTNDIRVWAILTICFVSPLGGIFLLLMKDKDFYDDIDKAKEDAFNAAVVNLETLKELKEKGQISVQEYETKRQKYLEVL